MFPSALVELVLHNTYVLLAPFILIEGPTAGVIGGVLINREILSFAKFFILFSTIEFIGDITFFWLLKNAQNIRLTFVKKLITRAKTNLAHSPGSQFFNNDSAAASVFLAKIIPVPYLMSAVTISASMGNLSVKKFSTTMLIAQPIWTAIIIGIGMTASASVSRFETTWGVFEIVSLVFFSMFLIKLFSRPKEEARE